MGSHSSPTTSLGTLDDMDMFFLSMSRMTKKLPKLEQARIKLELSNSVLSAEIRAHQQISSTPQHSVHSHEQSFCSSPASVSMTSPSDYSNHGGEQRPTLLDLTNVSFPSDTPMNTYNFKSSI